MQEEPPIPTFQPIRSVQAQEVEVPTPPQPEEEDAVEEEIEPSGVHCACVQWLRVVKGVNIRGNAWDIKNNSTPVKGGVILFSYTESDHAAYIEDITAEGFVISEANYKRCEVTRRTIAFDDPYIRGFYSGESPILASVKARKQENN